MSKLVVDNSVVLAWCLAGESQPLADAAMQRVVDEGALAPGIWWYELRNALVVNERRGRLTPADTKATLDDLRELDFIVDHTHREDVVLEIARQHNLSVYDAAYLELAARHGLALATLDARLGRAAPLIRVSLFAPNQ